MKRGHLKLAVALICLHVTFHVWGRLAMYAEAAAILCLHWFIGRLNETDVGGDQPRELS